MGTWKAASMASCAASSRSAISLSVRPLIRSKRISGIVGSLASCAQERSHDKRARSTVDLVEAHQSNSPDFGHEAVAHAGGVGVVALELGLERVLLEHRPEAEQRDHGGGP